MTSAPFFSAVFHEAAEAQATLQTIAVAKQELSSLKAGKSAYVQVGRVFFKNSPAVCAEKLKEREAACARQLAALQGNDAK